MTPTIRLLAIGAVMAVTVVAGVCGLSAAQSGTRAPAGETRDSIAREWAVRGVIVSGARRSAVLEYVPSGRQELVEVGDALTPTLSVIEVDPDRVVVSDGGAGTTTLRLAHGGQPRVIRRPVPSRAAGPSVFRPRR